MERILGGSEKLVYDGGGSSSQSIVPYLPRDPTLRPRSPAPPATPAEVRLAHGCGIERAGVVGNRQPGDPGVEGPGAVLVVRVPPHAIARVRVEVVPALGVHAVDAADDVTAGVDAIGEQGQKALGCACVLGELGRRGGEATLPDRDVVERLQALQRGTRESAGDEAARHRVVMPSSGRRSPRASGR